MANPDTAKIVSDLIYWRDKIKGMDAFNVGPAAKAMAEAANALTAYDRTMSVIAEVDRDEPLSAAPQPVQGIEAEELARAVERLNRLADDIEVGSKNRAAIRLVLSRLTPIIAGERETKAKNPLLPFAEHMLKNLRHFRQNTSGNQADAYYTFIKGEDEFWRNLENTVLALATQSPDLAGKGGAV